MIRGRGTRREDKGGRGQLSFGRRTRFHQVPPRHRLQGEHRAVQEPLLVLPECARARQLRGRDMGHITGNGPSGEVLREPTVRHESRVEEPLRASGLAQRATSEVQENNPLSRLAASAVFDTVSACLAAMTRPCRRAKHRKRLEYQARQVD